MQRSPPSPKMRINSHEKTQLEYPIPSCGDRQAYDNWEQVSRVPPVARGKCLQLRGSPAACDLSIFVFGESLLHSPFDLYV